MLKILAVVGALAAVALVSAPVVAQEKSQKAPKTPAVKGYLKEVKPALTFNQCITKCTGNGIPHQACAMKQCKDYTN